MTSPARRGPLVRVLAATTLTVGLAVTLTVGPATSGAAALPAAASPNPLRQAGDAVVAAGAVGYLARVDDGRRIVRSASGLADRATGRRLGPDDQFEIGSNTKTMIATIALQLVAEGRLRLDDPVRRVLPGVVPDDDRITLRMLLQHTSGLYSYTDPAFMAAVPAHPRAPRRPEDLVAAAVAHPPTFAPGTGWAYSDTNYVVVGLILQRVTGRTPSQLLQERIAGPLGLRHTYLPAPPGGAARSTGPGYAHGYLATFTGPQDAPVTHYTDVSSWSLGSFAGTAGAVISTAPELSRFLSALLGGRLLPAAQLAQMRTTVPTDAGFDYGLGLLRIDTPCGAVWGHLGTTFGHDSYQFGSADGRRTLVTDATTDTELVGQSPNAVTQALATAEGAASLTAVCRMYGRPVPGTRP